MTQGTELSVVIPALDEAESLSILLPQVRTALDACAASHEILVIDGGSRDATAEEALKGGAQVLRQSEPGFGAALREAIARARGRYILCMDADGSHPPAMIPRLWAERGRGDVVIGSRYVAGGSAQMPLLRLLLSRALNWLTRAALRLPVRDASSGLRLYRAEALRGLPLSRRDFSVLQEILLGLLSRGAVVLEVPLSFAPRIAGRSKARVWRLGLSYLGLLARASRLPVTNRG